MSGSGNRFSFADGNVVTVSAGEPGFFEVRQSKADAPSAKQVTEALQHAGFAMSVVETLYTPNTHAALYTGHMHQMQHACVLITRWRTDGFPPPPQPPVAAESEFERTLRSTLRREGVFVDDEGPRR